ncbi:MAG: enolase C-terminal domain-like protein [Bacteroidales bacterium]|jgi:L-alanine-DL-glutamate epimerase-like enolase superfamily enzyme
MKRRHFIKIAGTGVAAGFLGSRLPGAFFPDRPSDLGYHKIRDIRFTTVRLRYPRLAGKRSHSDITGTEIESDIHVLYTDNGASGWGLSKVSQKALGRIFDDIKGMTVEDLITPSTGVSASLEALDFSLFDLAGRILKRPVYRLLGKRRPEIFPCHSGLIFFDDLEPDGNPAGIEKILEECHSDYEYGFRQFKLQIGRGFKWMDREKGVLRDIEVTKLVSSHFPDCDILVDGSDGFTPDQFLNYLEGIGDTRLFWIEEPFYETTVDYAKLNSWLKVHKRNIYLADGRTDPDNALLKQLGSQKIVCIDTHDITDPGFTGWISRIRSLKLMGLMASPDAGGSAIETNYIAHLAGAFGSVPTIEGFPCTSDDLDLSGYRLKNGRLIPSSGSGFGMELMKKI